LLVLFACHGVCVASHVLKGGKIGRGAVEHYTDRPFCRLFVRITIWIDLWAHRAGHREGRATGPGAAS